MSGMSDEVRYETSEWAARRGAPTVRSSFADALIRWGVVSTREQAAYVLLGVAGLCLVIMLFVSYSLFATPTASVDQGKVDASLRLPQAPAAY